MTGPFRVRGPVSNAIEDANGQNLCAISLTFGGDAEQCNKIAEALCGVLNSAPADQPLDVTLANLAAGRHA